MANPLISRNTNPVQTQKPNIMQALGQFRQNPIGALKQAGYNIPDNMNNPEQIVNYLMQSGQLNNSKVGQITQMARNFGLIK